jgi:hypothetical protein
MAPTPMLEDTENILPFVGKKQIGSPPIIGLPLIIDHLPSSSPTPPAAQSQ